MKASDLPYNVRQQLLLQIEKQVGSTQYNKMVDDVGENKLIDFVLEKTEEMAKSQAPAKPKVNVRDIILALLGIASALHGFFVYLSFGITFNAGTSTAETLPYIHYFLGLFTIPSGAFLLIKCYSPLTTTDDIKKDGLFKLFLLALIVWGWYGCCSRLSE
jgi:hypothetical protein